MRRLLYLFRKNAIPGAVTVFALIFALAGAASAKESGFLGAKQCSGCHAGLADGLKTTAHAPLFATAGKVGPKSGCEACHGPGEAHLEDSEVIFKFDEASVKTDDVCLKCHSDGGKKGWRTSLHAGAELGCISCHRIHPSKPGRDKDSRKNAKNVKPAKQLKMTEPDLCLSCHTEKAAEINMASHHPVKQGKVACSSCHSPHENSALEQDRAAGKCVSCHQEKAGPFVNEHPPAAESCLACHTPHGSMNQNLLTQRTPALCLQCHTGTPVTHNTSQIAYKNCATCHTAIHGSNNSAKFMR